MHILLIFLPSLYISLHITLNFKRSQIKATKIEDYIYKMENEKLVTEMSAGTPKQSLKFSLRNTNDQLYIVAKESEKYPYSMKGFDEKSSTTYDSEDEFGDSLKEEYDSGFFSSDNFEIVKDKRLFFYLVKNLSISSKIGENDGNIGLSLNETEMSSSYNVHFIKDLKTYNHTSKPVFTFNFTDINQGNIIIGDFLENFDSRYTKKTYRQTKTIVVDNIQKWGFIGDEFYVGNIKLKDKVTFSVDFDRLFLTFPYHINYTLYTMFFKDYISSNVCRIVSKYNNEFYYVCDKDKIDIKKFPLVAIHLLDTKTKLNLTGEDLFFDYNDQVICGIAFRDIKFSETIPVILGTIFLKKYMMIFDVDRKINGFYLGDDIPPTPPKPTPVTKNSPLLIISLVIVCILALAIAVFSFRYIYKLLGRRKRATELNDDYDYDAIKL